MSNADQVYDQVSGTWYERRSFPLPRVRLARYRHTCPDETVVRVTGQWVKGTNATLYRWTVDGSSTECTSVPGRAGEPDWSAIDAQHPLFVENLPEPPPDDDEPVMREPDCYVCDDAGCAWCDPVAERIPVPAGGGFADDPSF